MGFKKAVVFILFLMTGAFLGSILTEMVQKIPALSFLTWGKTIGVGVPNPISVDLAVLAFHFGFSIQMNLAILLCIVGSLLVYGKIEKKI